MTNLNRVYNFSAGPAMLPDVVLKTAATEMLNYKNSGQSVMEMSHRSDEFFHIIDDCETLLRKVMNIPKNYKVLFLQGGASTQFAMVPMNLMTKNKCADFVLSGNWSEKAYVEAQKYGKANIIASSKESNYSYIPKVDPCMVSQDADYVHMCFNNTIYGTRFNEIPDTKNIPLVADISSFIASEPLDITKFSLIYASAQKNLAPAGLTIVIIKEDLINNPLNFTPTMLSYKTHAEKKSLYNTPPCYSIYICKLVLEWILECMGGLLNVKKVNEEKAGLLYEYLDNSNLFLATANKNDRSIMNVTFTTQHQKLDELFVEKAANVGIVNIKGHRKIGGMRASIYNAMPIDGVYYLVNFMKEFEDYYK